MDALKSPYELAALAAAAVPNMRVTAVFGPHIQEETRASTRISDAEGNTWTVTATAEESSPAQLGHRAELLDFLAQCHESGQLPFAVPQVTAYAPMGGGMYAQVLTVTSGSPATESELSQDGLLAGSIGRSLAAFHNLKPAEFQRFNCPSHSVVDLRKTLNSSISTVGREIPGRLRKRWLVAIQEDVLWSFDPGPVHANLSLQSVLTSHGAVRSITDCEHTEIGDPAADLDWLLPLVSDDFLERLVSAYSGARSTPDLHLFTRAQLYSELALLEWLRFGMAEKNSDIVAEAKQMLVDLDTDLAGQMLVAATRPVVQVHFEAADEPLNRIGKNTQSVEWDTQIHDMEEEVGTTTSGPEDETEAFLSSLPQEPEVSPSPSDEDPAEPASETSSYEFPRK